MHTDFSASSITETELESKFLELQMSDEVQSTENERRVGWGISFQ